MKIRIVFAVLLFVSSILSAQTFRVGSPTPENSPWGRALNRVAAEWERISDGRVQVQIFHGSVAGTEADMVRKMRIGQLQAVVVSVTGLSNFSHRTMTMSAPLLIRNQDEYNYVLERVKGSLEDDILQSGFHVMAWSFSGWTYFFADREIRTPADLHEAKLAASPEEMELVRVYQLMGYQPIPLSYTERLFGLSNGVANAYLTVPILAAGFQWFALTPNMTDLPISPAPAAVLMSNRAYQRLPSDIRDEMFEVIQSITADLDGEIQALEGEAISTMKQHGLNVVTLTPDEVDAWVQEFNDSSDVSLGLLFDEELYNRITDLLAEYRAGL